MYTLNMNFTPVNYAVLSQLLIASGLHWKMPLGQLIMVEKAAFQEQFVVTSEVTTTLSEEQSKEIMTHKGKHTLMGLPIQLVAGGDDQSFIELWSGNDRIARLEHLPIPEGI